MRLFLLLCASTSLLLAAPVPKAKAKPKDAELILGTWRVESVDVDGGQNVPRQSDLEKINFIYGEKDTLKMTDMNSMSMEGTFKIDSEAKLKSIDMTMKMSVPVNSPERTILAVYELDGDTLKLCFAQGAPGKKERPEELKAIGAKMICLATLKRVKPEDKKDK